MKEDFSIKELKQASNQLAQDIQTLIQTYEEKYGVCAVVEIIHEGTVTGRKATKYVTVKPEL